jgi:hypothetical protein
MLLNRAATWSRFIGVQCSLFAVRLVNSKTNSPFPTLSAGKGDVPTPWRYFGNVGPVPSPGAPGQGTRPTGKSTPHPGPLPGRGGEGGSRHERKETERFKSFAYEELTKRDKVNLDIFWLKDDALEESANLPAPEVIAQEITDDLEAALEQFSTITEDLKK